MSGERMDKTAMRWKQIERFLEVHPFIMNADMRMLCNVSAATANRILAKLVVEKKLAKYFRDGHWTYEIRE